MPRLKLPTPAKRHERRLKTCDKIAKMFPRNDRVLVASVGYTKGYDHALRDAHRSLLVSYRIASRRRWASFTRHLDEVNQLRARIAELEKR